MTRRERAPFAGAARAATAGGAADDPVTDGNDTEGVSSRGERLARAVSVPAATVAVVVIPWGEPDRDWAWEEDCDTLREACWEACCDVAIPRGDAGRDALREV